MNLCHLWKGRSYDIMRVNESMGADLVQFTHLPEDNVELLREEDLLDGIR